jgi:hypothetical protein
MAHASFLRSSSRFAAAAFLASALGLQNQARALNPIIQNIYTADPAPLVHGDTVYVYVGHDEDDAQHYKMIDWRLYSSKDMVNWTDHGSPLSLKNFSWADSSAWAGQAIERDGKFYWYVPVGQRTGGMAIGVAVADSPTGPFKDALGRPLIFDKFGDIDPAPFIDKDGQAYLAWGNPTYKYVKLNRDMVSYDQSFADKGIFRHQMTVAAFGKIVGTDAAEAYEEGPWIYERQGIYYLFFAGSPIPEHLAYSTGPSPEGPWTYGGVVMPAAGMSSTNHAGVIDFKGRTYLFYHNDALPGGGSYKRSVCIEELHFEPDGSIRPVSMTKEGVRPVATLDPYARVEAETIAWQNGLETEPLGDGMLVHDIDDGDHIRVMNVEFGENGASAFTAHVRCDTRPRAWRGGEIELRLDKIDGPVIGTLPIGYTAGEWKSETTSVSGAKGTRDLYFVFKGESTGDLFKIDHWNFTAKASEGRILALQSTLDRYKIDETNPDDRVKIKVAAIYSDGTSKDITAKASIIPSRPDVVSVKKGVVTGTALGEVSLAISAEGLDDTLPLIVKDLKPERTPSALRFSLSGNRMVTRSTQPFKVTVDFADGHSEELTHAVTCTSSAPEVLRVENGTLVAVREGQAVIRGVFKDEGVEPINAQISVEVSNRDGFAQNEFEDSNEQLGLIVENSTEAGKNLCDANNGEWCRFDSVDFGRGAKALDVRVASASAGGTLEVRLDSLEGPVIAVLQVDTTRGWQNWVTKTADIREVTGTHDVFFKFVGGTGVLFNVNWWRVR